MLRKRAAILAAVVVTILIGCSKTKTTEPQSNTGTLQVNMIDGPARYDQVNIVVDSVLAHIASSDSMHGWTTLNRVSATYDLLTLVNGANAVIGTAVLPVGRYTQIRLHTGSGSTVVIDGVPHPLVTPSGSQSGVKLNIDASIQPGTTYLLTLDFDANKSVVATGDSAGPVYSLKPAIRIVATGTTGIIAGAVIPAATKPTIWAFGVADSVSTSADTNGGFMLLSLDPGTYKILIDSKGTLYRDTTLTNVVMIVGATTDLGTIILTYK
jgi:hypothetical protein